MGETASFKYHAFLSYAHADTGRAKWLHKRLEGFRFDRDVVGRETPRGRVPKALRPIFRDREEFSAGQSLTEATVAALDASAALIVMCSTVAAGRPAVNEEVRLFRTYHPDRPVIPVMIDGKYPDNYPPALRFEVAADGTVTDRPVTILGPDLREAADGRSLGLAKVVAELTGLDSSEIFRRVERTRRRTNRIWAALVGAFFLLAVGAVGGAIYARQQLKKNEAFLNETLHQATEILGTAVRQADSYEVPRSATLELLTRAERLFDDIARNGPGTPQLQYEKALMLIEFARSYAVLGDPGKQLERATEAYGLLAGLAEQSPDDTTWQLKLSLANAEIGNMLLAQDHLPEALKAFREGHAIDERLAQSAPNDTSLQRDLSVSYTGIGEVLFKQGHRQGAEEAFSAALAIAERLAQADPGNAVLQRRLVVSCVKIAEIDSFQARTLLTRASQIVGQMQQRGLLARQDAWMPAELAQRIAALPK